MSRSPFTRQMNGHSRLDRGSRRRVYDPPKIDAGWAGPVTGAILITLGVFLVLPLTQMVSSRMNKQLLLSKVETASLQAPPEIPPPLEPPPREEPPEEPKPELQEMDPSMNLAIPDLDLAVGTGGVLGTSGLPSDALSNANDSLSAFDISDLDKPPSVISSISPRYPQELLRGKVEGTVVIVFIVDESGRVEDPRVESSEHPQFEKPALDAVRRWRFQPGSRDGTAVKTFMRLPMRFRINS